MCVLALIVVAILCCATQPARFINTGPVAGTLPLAVGTFSQGEGMWGTATGDYQETIIGSMKVRYNGDPIVSNNADTDAITPLAAISVPYNANTPRQFVTSRPTSTDDMQRGSAPANMWTNPYPGSKIFPRPLQAVTAAW